MPQTRFEFEVLDVLKGGTDAPVGRSWAIGANDGLMRGMAHAMCKGDPVPSPQVDGYETTATWKAGEHMLLFLQRQPDGMLRMQVQDAFEVTARREEVARVIAAASGGALRRGRARARRPGLTGLLPSSFGLAPLGALRPRCRRRA